MLRGLFADLDAEAFEVRRQTAERLDELAGQTAWQEQLALAVHEALLDEKTSTEVRLHLEILAARLPQRMPAPPASLAPGELDRLIRQLDADRFGARLGAAERLRWLVEWPEWACAAVVRLKRLRREPGLPAETRQRIEPIWYAARRVWLASDPAAWRLPSVADGEIRGWIDDLALPERAAGPSTARLPVSRWQVAEEELLDLLIRDEYLPRVQAALQERLASGRLDAAAAARLEAVVAWTRPTLAVEFWQEQQNLSLDYLVVGEPGTAQGFQMPCLFDRVDDQTAHCQSGDRLKPGPYRVGALFPVPSAFGSDSSGLFRLVNLPSPRRRMADELDRQRNEAQRYAEICQATIDDLLAQRRPLREAELVMLEHLAAEATSRFAGEYLPAQGDPKPADRDRERRMGRGSAYESLCCLLVEIGTRDAMPGLLRAIEAKRFAPPAGEGRCDWPWIAALAIAQRDPWTAGEQPAVGRNSLRQATEEQPAAPLPACDDWLAGLIERTDPLSAEGAQPPELGATAAAILLERHGIDPARMGLEWAGDRLLAEVGGPNWRFISPAMRQGVVDWWREQRPQP